MVIGIGIVMLNYMKDDYFELLLLLILLLLSETGAALVKVLALMQVRSYWYYKYFDIYFITEFK